MRLIYFVKKRLITLRNFSFLSLSINLSLRDDILTREIECQNSSLSSNEAFHPRIEVLNDILDKCNSHGKKRGLGYINKIETPTSGDTIFVKGKKETPNQVAFPSTPLLCTYRKKYGHTQSRCHSRLHERYESHLNRLMDC